MRSRSWQAAVMIGTLVACSVLASAQSATTSLRGTITDAKGAVLNDATVTLDNNATGFSRTTKTARDGAYQFLEVPPATYVLTVNSAGFATLKQDRVVLQVSQPATLNITMEVKGRTEIVEVTGTAPLVNTTDASQGNVFNSTQLTNLPSEGRDPVSILSLQPGVTYLGSNTNQDNSKPNQTEDSRGGAVAGARSDQTNVTVDGLDNNDQLLGLAFQGALRVPLDSIQEFRVTTTNSNADSGRSSGAQVNMVTKSGTNSFHGTMYEYNRSNIGQANDWFNEQAEVQANLPNKPGVLHRNTFGAWVGGPIMKDRLFFFGGYEGQRSNEAIQVTRVVPSTLMRTGVLQYPCNPSSDPNCQLGTSNANFTIASNSGVPTGDYLVTMSPAGLANIDQNCASAVPATCNWTAAGYPYNGGADPYVANVNGSNPGAIFTLYPQPNTDAVGDGFDYRGFTFPAPSPKKHDTYILKLDEKLTASGNHSLFLKGHLQNFRGDPTNGALGIAQFPGLPPNEFLTNNSKAISAGYTALFTSTLINNLRYGFVRQGLGDSGLGVADYNFFRGMDNYSGAGFTPTTLTNVPVHNVVDDVSWTKGKHTFGFGGNLRIITNNRTGNAQNYSYAYTNVYWLNVAGISNKGTSLDPATGAGYPAVDPAFGTNYDFATAALAGLLTQTNVVYNQDKTGHFFSPGQLITRNFRSHEGEFYFQDSWRATPNLVLTGGVRYSLLQPPFETNGNQVSPSISLNSWFHQRATDMLQGIPLNSQNGGLIQMELAGRANGKEPYWAWDYKDIAPRLAFAYSPHADSGFLHTLFGGAGKSSIRGGAGIYFDHFGEGIVNSFDRNGSFGLTTALDNPAGSQTVDCTPRLTSLFTLPPANTDFCGQQVVGPPPPAFPGLVTPPTLFNPGSFAIYWGLDNKLKTPYSEVVDLSFTRDLGKNFVVEASYIGRFAHRLLQEEDLASPLDIVDPQSKTDYFTAASALTKAHVAGTDISNFATNPIPFWQNLFPGAAGQLGFGPPGSSANLGCAPGDNVNATNYNATQAMYDMFSCFSYNETSALFFADLYCLPACAQLPGQTSGQPFNFYDDQFSSLYAWRSVGNSSYNGLQLTLRKAMSDGLQFDFNYVYSKSIDIGSNAERINEFEGGGFASQIINAWAPNQLRAVSDFDMRHQINSNWVYALPFGRGRAFGATTNKFVDAVFGGWGLSGIFHWTSGLPFSMASGAGWSTNWQLQGTAIEVANPGKVGIHRQSDGTATMWQDVSTTGQAYNAFTFPLPGSSGQRNELRGQGFFEIDSGLFKTWKITETQSAKFAWEAFNVTNTPKFDAAQGAYQFSLVGGIFGAYTSTLSVPRVMQFSMRYEF